MATGAISDYSAVNLPSRVEEKEPTVARVIGLLGGTILFFALIMSVMNARTDAANERLKQQLKEAHDSGEVISPEKYQPLRHMWIPSAVFFSWIFGISGLLYHASRKWEEVRRRLYGLFAYALLALGMILTVLAIGSHLFEKPLIIGIAGALAVLLVGLTATPFAHEDMPAALAKNGDTAGSPLQLAIDALIGWPVRWFQTLGGSPRVQQATLAGAVLIGIISTATASLLAKPGETTGYYGHFLGYGLGCLGVGLAFVLAYNGNETAPAWKDAVAYPLGGFGVVCTLAGFASIFLDLSSVETMRQFLLPNGMILGVLGLIAVWAYIFMVGGETDQGYAAGWFLVMLGAAIMVAAATRGAFQKDYFVPAGFLLLALGFANLFVGACFTVDWPLMAMTRRELTAIFYSPIAYVVIGGTALFAWLAFLNFSRQLVSLTPGIGAGEPTLSPNPVSEPILIGYLVDWYPIFFLIVSVPLVTMRLFSDEWKQGTIETLLTAPVSETSVVLSKFFGVLIFYVLAWGTWAFFPAVLRIVGQEPFDYLPLLSYFLGLAVVSAGFLAMGLFISSLFRDQINALLTTLVAMFGLTIIFFFFVRIWGQELAEKKTLLAVFQYVNTVSHMFDFAQGKVYYVQLLYHLSACVFWLFLTTKVLESRKWK